MAAAPLGRSGDGFVPKQMLKPLLNIAAYRNAFTELVGRLRQHRELTLAMTKREITDRYAGQVLGTIWVFAHPLVMMSVYVFVFALCVPAENWRDL